MFSKIHFLDLYSRFKIRVLLIDKIFILRFFFTRAPFLTKYSIIRLWYRLKIFRSEYYIYVNLHMNTIWPLIYQYQFEFLQMYKNIGGTQTLYFNVKK